MGKANSKNCYRQSSKRIRDNNNDPNQEFTPKRQTLCASNGERTNQLRTSEEVPILGRESPLHNQTSEARTMNSRESSWETDVPLKPTKFANGNSHIEVFTIINRRRDYAKERKPRIEKPRKRKSHKGVRRCILRRGTSNISKQVPIDNEWTSHYVVIPTTEYHSSINNRSGIYRHFGSRQRCSMATSIYRGTINEFQSNNIHRQRSSLETHQDPNLPPTITAHRPQIPLHSGTGQTETTGCQRDTGEGEPSRHYDQNCTNEYIEGMEEQDVLDALMKEWINEG